jgi:aryl-alcohol dehydrogenase-like predicted oxidoreductase
MKEGATDSYDPKHKDLRLTRGEKCVIALGSLFVVILLVLIRHPELYSTVKSSNRSPLRISTDSINPFRAFFPAESGLVRGYATAPGTELFAKKAGLESLSFSYRADSNKLILSSIGLGTYMGEVTDEVDKLIEDAVYESIHNGVNVLDTSINYRGMKSERAIRSGLKRVFSSGLAKRESIFVSTKAGFIPADADGGKSPKKMAAEWASMLEDKEELIDNKHCIAPACLNSSLLWSRENLGLETIDLFYLHNAAEKQLESITEEDLMDRLKTAFEFLESQRALNYIRYYGLATWTCFRTAAGGKAYLPLKDVVELAQEVGGENHGFRYVQLPLTLSLPEAAVAEYDVDQEGDVSLTFMDAARALNISVMTSRSIGAANTAELEQVKSAYESCVKPDSPWGPEALRKLSGDVELTPVALSLLITKSVPGVTTALVGMKAPEHVKENLAVMKIPPIPEDIIKNCFFDSAKESVKVSQLDSSESIGDAIEAPGMKKKEESRMHLRHTPAAGEQGGGRGGQNGRKKKQMGKERPQGRKKGGGGKRRPRNKAKSSD